MLSVEFWIERVEIPAVKFFLYNAETLAKTLIVHDLALSQEADGITDFRIFDQTENIVVSCTRFLFWGDLVKTTYKNTRKNR